ncbi:MAG: hypothetical protein ACTHN8_16330 [Angustibacter sp.]
MRTKLVIAAMLAMFAFYAVTIGWRGVLLVRDGRPAAVALGLGVLVLPLVAGWAVWKEVRFGLATQRLARILDAEGGLPVDDLPRRPSGRVDRAAADAAFEGYRREVEAEPGDWRAWYRLATAYDAAGDRRRARAAARQAIARSADSVPR